MNSEQEYCYEKLIQAREMSEIDLIFFDEKFLLYDEKNIDSYQIINTVDYNGTKRKAYFKQKSFFY